MLCTITSKKRFHQLEIITNAGLYAEIVTKFVYGMQPFINGVFGINYAKEKSECEALWVVNK
jgi:hypothetical protein